MTGERCLNLTLKFIELQTDFKYNSMDCCIF